MQGIKKIVVIGPESTGKSMLCELLAVHFQSLWVPEYARQYLLKHGKQYDYDDLLKIAKGQVAMEEERTKQSASSSTLFIDTDMYVMKVWCEFVFGKCHEWILNQIRCRRYNLYLLCNSDLPWVKDELREYPDPETRGKLFQIYKDCMLQQQTPWMEISGNYTERLNTAISAVDALISENA